jgi:hypothetical protein
LIIAGNDHSCETVGKILAENFASLANITLKNNSNNLADLFSNRCARQSRLCLTIREGET